MCSDASEAVAARCTLCPAGCTLALARTGPDLWRPEYPTDDAGGLCPRGSMVGEFLGHRRRIRDAFARAGGGAPMALDAAAGQVVSAAGAGPVTILLDGNLPCEQMVAAAAWCASWQQAGLCLVIEPGDEQLLLGTEASGAEYLAEPALRECDGFLIVGDAFAANPMCSRGVLDRRAEEPRTPVVAIDPARGTAGKFASHCLEVAPGGEAAALAAVAAGAGVDVGFPAGDVPGAAAAGKALAACKRVGVLLAAEHGRTAAWRQIGYAAGAIAKALGGGVAPQTTGANALAAVRLAAGLKTLSLAEALSRDGVKVAIGCDVVGMLGPSDVKMLAAAAALPNRTTDQAEVVLPLASPGEVGGTFILSGDRTVEVAALLAAPAGVRSAVEIVAALGEAAGAAAPQPSAGPGPIHRIWPEPPGPPGAEAPAGETVLLLGRQAAHSGCGALTAHGSWQAPAEPVLRVAPSDAEWMHLKNLAHVTVRAGNGGEVRARVRIAPELPGGAVVLPEGLPDARALLTCTIDAERGGVVSTPAACEVS